MSNNIEANTMERLEKAMRNMADFVALYEQAEERLEAQQQAYEARQAKTCALIEQEIGAIKTSLQDFHEILTQTGAARWRAEAKELLNQGKDHLHQITDICNHFAQTLERNHKIILSVSQEATQRIAEASELFRIEDFKRITQEGAQLIDQATLNAIKRISKIARWFHWEKMGIAIIVAVIVSLTTGLFINDELPWESHSKVMAEREAGKALIRAWPQLTSQEREHIKIAAESNL